MMIEEKNKVAEWLESAPQKRQELSTDPHRPHYHFLPPNNWMNDPNGLIHWNGQYHMFYQHNPHNPFWGDIHWGHAVSDDLVHWKDLPLALIPDALPIDDGGCWSGSAVNNNGVPTILYTGVQNREQTTCLATSDENLLVWQKDKTNPILKAPQLPGFRHQDYRDPFVWREGDTWYQAVSMTIHNQGQALLYRSSDLRDWEYLHPLISQEEREKINDIADIWECPNFFQLGGNETGAKWVLIVSVWKNHTLLYPIAFVGEFRDLHFYPEQQQRLDWGEQCLYAPLTFQDEKNRRLMFGWLQEQRSKEAQLAAGWSGVMSLPRVLSLENNKVKLDFASELQTLRKEKIELSDVTLAGLQVIDGMKSDGLELQLSLQRNLATRSGIALCHSEDEQTTIGVDWLAKELVIDTATTTYKAIFEGLETTVDLHLYADHSVIEVIANRDVALTCRVYPKQAGGSVKLFSEGQSQVLKLKAWNLDSIWS
jgi:beta-fructofuranosidase